ncbi:MAG: FkbM family methyltransferase [Rhizobiaceae bacterium]
MKESKVLETIRRKIRYLLGYDSGAYRFASAFYNNAAILLREGPVLFFKLRSLSKMEIDKDTHVSLKFRRLRYPVFVRPGTQDIGAIVQNIVREEYGAFELDELPQTLIDAGAYIGDTSAYFLSRYPTLQSIALEPNPESYLMAEKNLLPYRERVSLLPFALSATEDPVYFSGDEMGAKINESGDLKVEAITIPKLLERFSDGRVNILKMDIEGAEDEIFRVDISEWLPKVDCIIVETHGPDITRNVLGALRSNGWIAKQFRNLYFCRPML